MANAILGNLKGGVKLLGGGVVDNVAAATPGSVYYHLELPEGESVLVFPDLLSRLQSYSVFRQKDASLVIALRAKALEWCRAEIPAFAWVWPLAIPSAVALALRESESEATARALIEAENITLHPES